MHSKWKRKRRAKNLAAVYVRLESFHRQFWIELVEKKESNMEGGEVLTQGTHCKGGKIEMGFLADG